MKDQSKKRSVFDNPILSTKVKSANVKPFPELLFGYFIGPFGALLASGIFGAYLNTYFTNVLFRGEDIRVFGTLLPLLSTILIVAGNLIAGQLIERTKTKAGKARPWILLSTVVLCAACILMFVIPHDANMIVRMVWYAISYNLYYSVAYPLYNTANSTLIPTSTRNSSQRGLLASATNVASLGVMGAGSMVFPTLAGFLLFDANENPVYGAWMVMFIVVGVFTALCCILQYYFTRERVTEETINVPKEQHKKVSVAKQLSAVGKEPFWWIIIIFYLVFQFSGGMKNLSMQYFCQWVLEPLEGMTRVASAGLTQTILGVLGAVPMAIAVVFVWPLSNKYGKKNVTLVGMIVGVIGGVIAWIGGNNIVPVAIGVALKCLGSAPACYMILAMISDVLDHVEAKSGFRCDGLTMSIYSAIMVASTPHNHGHIQRPHRRDGLQRRPLRTGGVHRHGHTGVLRLGGNDSLRRLRRAPRVLPRGEVPRQGQGPHHGAPEGRSARRGHRVDTSRRAPAPRRGEGERRGGRGSQGRAARVLRAQGPELRGERG